MTNLKQAISDAGGALQVAKACGVSVRAVYKWVASGSLPRTEYTGETHYAEKIAAAAGGALCAQTLLECTAPGRVLKVRQDSRAG